MRSYFSYIDEINKKELLEGLLGYGMFSDKLPPIFSSAKFYSTINNSSNKLKNQIINESSYSDYIRFDTIKYDSDANLRTIRTISIPNPIPYTNLCIFCQIDLKKLRNTLNKKQDKINIKSAEFILESLKAKNAYLK